MENTDINKKLKSAWPYWLLGFLFLFAVAAAIVVRIYYWQETGNIPASFEQPVHKEKVDETANWKTYTNDNYGFEFKYPQDWLIEGNIQNKGILIVKRSDQAGCPPEGCLSNMVSFQISNRVNNTSLKSFVEKNWKQSNTIEETSINNLPVVRASGFNTMNTQVPWIAVCLADTAKFYCFNSQEDTSGNIYGMNQILSTFKFTK